MALEMVARGCPRLKRLVLRDCNALTAAALPTFAMFEQLEYLDVAGCEGLLTFTTRVSTHGAARLAELSALPERCLMLKALVVYACTYVPDEHADALAARLDLKRTSCGCERCVGLADAELRLRLRLFQMQHMGRVAMGQYAHGGFGPTG